MIPFKFNKPDQILLKNTLHWLMIGGGRECLFFWIWSLCLLFGEEEEAKKIMEKRDEHCI